MSDFFLGTNFQPETLVELLRWRATHQPERQAYTFLTDEQLDRASTNPEGASLTYGEVDQRARAIGAWMQASGIIGERVILLFPPGLDYITAFYGSFYAGNTVVPVYPPQTAQGVQALQAIAQDADARMVLTTSAFRARLEPLLALAPVMAGLRWLNTDHIAPRLENNWREPNINGETLAFLQYTSGTTGIPKGVMLTHRNIVHHFSQVTHHYPTTADTRFLTWLPLYHNTGFFSGLLQPLYVGYRSIQMSPISFLQSPPRWLHAISRYRIEISGGPDFAYNLCVRYATPELLAAIDLSSWAGAFTGSEHVRMETLKRFANTFEVCGFRREAFYAAYGLTEATLMVSAGMPLIKRAFLATALGHNRVIEAPADQHDARTLVGSGPILPGQKIAIVNQETLTEVADEEVGEIWVAGPSVSKGYWNHPEETEKTFRAFLYHTGEGPFLRTGDLGFICGEQLFVTGRLKELIIIRGRNHYPQDIEATIERCHPAVRPGGSAVFSIDDGDEERLVVMQEVLEGATPPLDSVIDAIRQSITQEHGVQTHAVLLLKEGTIPKTGNNKIQRQACRQSFLTGTLEALKAWQSDGVGGEDESIAAPPLERPDCVADIESWLTATLIARMGVVASELDLTLPITSFGLDSLTAIELTHSIETTFDVSLPMWLLLRGPSIAELAAEILEWRESGSSEARVEIASKESPDEFAPLSHNQRSLWFVHQIAPESAAYNIAGAVRIHAELDGAALRRAFQKLIDRHASLRTTFVALSGEPFQRVREHMEVFLEEEDASSTSEESLNDRLTELAHRPFNLEHDALIRFYLFKRSAREHILLSVMHHIVSDLWSVSVLLDELRVLYASERKGSPASLPPLPLTYSDFVHWQAEMLASKENELMWGYWSKQLAGELPALNLLTDRPRPPIQTFRGASHFFSINAELTAKLKALGQSHAATLYMTLLAAFELLLHRYTGQEDILVGSVTAGRSRQEWTGVVGYFVNPLVLRAKFSAEQTFAGFLAEMRRTVLDALEHQDYPFALLVERLRPRREASRSPLFQVMFVLQQAQLLGEEGLASFALGEAGGRIRLGELDLESLALDQRVAQFDITFMVAEKNGTLGASFEYNTDLFDATTIERMAGHFLSLLSAITLHPDVRMGTLPLLTSAEQHKLLVEWNQTGAQYETSCLHHLIERQVERTPDACALSFAGQHLSYRQLNERANQLAHHLRRHRVGPEVLVAVLLERRPELVIGLLAVLKAGGAYLPLDPAYPSQRLSFMLEDSGAQVLLTQAELASQLSAPTRLPVVKVDSDGAEIGSESRENPVAGSLPQHLAYVIYTSGSTGSPKGVAIEHQSAVTLLHWAADFFPEESFKGVLAATSICFDLSVFELFAPLSVGGKVVLAENALSLPLLPARDEVTLINTVPSAMTELVRMRSLPASVCTVNLAGEALKNSLVQQLYALAHVGQVFNLYGPSEDTTYSTAVLTVKDAQSEPTIGKPISQTQAYVLDAAMQPVPVGVAGELFIGGSGLARGYLRRPELTAARFIPQPFSDAPGARLYRTGDLARFLPTGEIEFLGRVDQQVKVRGFRIELGEIQAVLEQQAGVHEAVVVVREAAGEKRLVGYVVVKAAAQVAVGDLRKCLRERLPEYMVPSALVILDHFPLTPNGKIDRLALPAPGDFIPEMDGSQAAPRDPVEEVMAGLWGQLLGLERVGIDDNFFDLGGHSLLATQLVSRIREALHIQLPLINIFESPTVSGLAAKVRGALSAGRSLQSSPIKRVSRGEALPLSYAQQRLWFLEQLEADIHPYHMPGAVRLNGPLHVDALEWSLNEIVNRHEMLRTTFVMKNDQPWQIINPSLRIALPVIDLHGLTETTREIEIQRVMRLAIDEPFDLAVGPLFRVRLLKLDDAEHIMLLVMHHIISDGWSMGVFIREMTAHYRAYVEGAESPLPSLPIQYADYAVWQRRCMEGEALEEQATYWRRQLQDSPPLLELPTDYPRPALLSFRGAKLPLEIPRSLSEALKALSQQQGVTLFMTLLAAFNVLLNRYTRQEDITVGTSIAGRTQVELEGLIGFFVNTLVLRSNLAGNPTFTELLARVREMTLEAYAHQDLPFEKLVEEVQPERSLGHTPLFQVMLTLQNAPSAELKLPGIALTPVEVSNETAKFDLALSLEEDERGLLGSLTYNTDILEAETIARLLAHFRTLLQSIVANPQLSISSLPLLSATEQHLLLNEWNLTAPSFFEQRCLHECFEEQAAQRSAEVAVVCGNQRLSYEELNERANQLAHYLRRLGVGPEVLVGLYVERSVEAVVGVLGILKAGGAYLPLDSSIPLERLSFIIADARLGVLLTQERLAKELPGQDVRVICLDADRDALGLESAENPAHWTLPEHLAYVIYTSGSTGTPKGVMIQHRSVSNLYAALHRAIYNQYQRPLRVGLNAPLSFDSSVKQIVQLAAGRTLEIVPEEVRRDGSRLLSYLEDHRLDVLDCTPSQLRLLIDEGLLARAGQRPRLVLVGGEEVDAALWQAMAADTPRAFYNVYGPTECTVDATACRVQSEQGRPSIGRPLANTQVYILDSNLQIVPIGVAGELFIGGMGLARGYLRRPEWTASRFLPHPFSPAPGERLYRTGDLARWLPTGEIEFLGRADSQVKLRGFRVELGEVEAVLERHAGVRQAAVVLREDAGEKRLVAYVVLGGAGAEVNQLRSYLREWLPEYMVPAAVMALEQLPLTPNGKLDHRALPALDQARPKLTNMFVAPRTAEEEALAAIWADLLRLEQVGIEDNFFDLGGHSLLATQLISRTRSAFQIEVPLRAVFEKPTIRGLIENIEALRWAMQSVADPSVMSMEQRETGEL